MREEALVADRAGVDVADLADAGGAQALVGDRAQVEPAPVHVCVRAGERGVHLGADLVAAGAARRGRSTAAISPLAAELAQRAHALLEHARGEAAPAGVEHRDGAVAAERDRQAVGGQHHRADSRAAPSRGRRRRSAQALRPLPMT